MRLHLLLFPLVLFCMAAAQPDAMQHQIRLACFIPTDRKPPPSYELKIRNIISIVSDIYLQDLKGKNFNTPGLRFEPDEKTKSQPKILLIKGDHPASYYNNAPAYNADEQWRLLQAEVKSKIGNPQRQVIVVFAETYDDGPAEHLWPGVIARGGYNSADGGLAIFSGHILRDEFSAPTPAQLQKLFFDQTPIPGRRAWGQKMNSARGQFIEDGIGAVIHELGHALGLPHDRRQDDIDIMGNGFRNLRWNFTPNSPKRARFSEECGLLLMSSRHVAGDLDLTDSEPPKLQATAKKMPAGWIVSIKATDNTGLRAIVFVDRTAGSITVGRKLSGKSQEFIQPLADIKSPNLKLQILLTDNAGHQTRQSIDGP